MTTTATGSFIQKSAGNPDRLRSILGVSVDPAAFLAGFASLTDRERIAVLIAAFCSQFPEFRFESKRFADALGWADEGLGDYLHTGRRKMHLGDRP